MEPASALSLAKPLSAGWGPTISYRGKCFPGRVLACEKPLGPGEIGEAIVGIITSSPYDIDMQVGSTFELRDGPTNLIATATVLNFVEEN
jgi:hypothetical protein